MRIVSAEARASGAVVAPPGPHWRRIDRIPGHALRELSPTTKTCRKARSSLTALPRAVPSRRSSRPAHASRRGLPACLAPGAYPERAQLPRSARCGPSPEGRMSKSKIAVGR